MFPRQERVKGRTNYYKLIFPFNVSAYNVALARMMKSVVLYVHLLYFFTF